VVAVTVASAAASRARHSRESAAAAAAAHHHHHNDYRGESTMPVDWCDASDSSSMGWCGSRFGLLKGFVISAATAAMLVKMRG